MKSLRTPSLLTLLALTLAAGFESPSASATEIAASSQLAGIRDFMVYVRIQSKGQQALRDMPDIENRVSNAIVDTLRAGGLRYEDTSPLSLNLSVEYSYNPTETNWVAISFRLELHERVKLERRVKTAASSHTHSVVSWMRSEVDLVPATRSESTMIARARGFAQVLVDEVKVATQLYRVQK